MAKRVPDERWLCVVASRSQARRAKEPKILIYFKYWWRQWPWTQNLLRDFEPLRKKIDQVMIPVQLLAIRLNEHQKLAKVEQAGSEMTKALSQNVAICCAYFHKYDSDRHYNVVGPPLRQFCHKANLFASCTRSWGDSFLNCGQSKIVVYIIADSAASDRGCSDKWISRAVDGFPRFYNLWHYSKCDIGTFDVFKFLASDLQKLNKFITFWKPFSGSSIHP